MVTVVWFRVTDAKVRFTRGLNNVSSIFSRATSILILGPTDGSENTTSSADATGEDAVDGSANNVPIPERYPYTSPTTSGFHRTFKALIRSDTMYGIWPEAGASSSLYRIDINPSPADASDFSELNSVQGSSP
jgi:hypothetical protein